MKVLTIVFRECPNMNILSDTLQRQCKLVNSYLTGTEHSLNLTGEKINKLVLNRDMIS